MNIVTTPLPIRGGYSVLNSVCKVDKIDATTPSGDYIVGSYFIRVRPMREDANAFSPKGHKHTYDHVTVCLTGKLNALLWVNGDDSEPEKFEMTRGNVMNVPAGIKHGFEIVEKGSRFACMFAHREKDGTPTHIPTCKEAY